MNPALTALLPMLLCGPPAEPYADYQTPDTLPLDLEWGTEQTTDGVAMRRLRYTSCRWDGVPIRVFALYAAPTAPGPHPAVLHIHGGTQTASPQDVADMVRHGYACLSFDWTGLAYERRPEDVTLFPAGLGDLRRVEPSPRWSHVAQIILAARRGIDLLAGRPEVDATRLGAYGISWGGFATFLLNALEPRLRCAVPVYCCGWMPVGQEQAAPDEPWHKYFEPYSYASWQMAPLLYLSGTNDFSGIPDKMAEIQARMPRGCALSYTLHTNHHLAAPQAEAGYRFLAHHLQAGPALAATPELELGARGGRLVAAVKAPGAVRVVVAVSEGAAAGVARFWRETEATARDGLHSATLPVSDPEAALWVLAQAAYPGGYELSSALRITTAREAGATEADLAAPERLYDPRRGGEGWCESRYHGGTQLWSHRGFALRAHHRGGPEGGPWLEVWRPDGARPPLAVGFHGSAASPRRGTGATGLRLHLAGGPEQISLVAYEHWSPGGGTAHWTAALRRETLEWHALELPADALRTDDGRAIDDLGRVDYLELVGPPSDTPLRIGAMDWIR